ncbi:MAG: ABC transporter substrate-binding protein, partial [Traorella sp.]
MKKVLGLSLCALMVASALTGCGNKKVTSLDYTNSYSNDLSNMDYVLTSLAVDHEYNANFVDGLVENDSYGNFVGALAEKWESNEDATEFTFTLRKGVKWVTNEGEEYAEVTAEDFVTGLRHAAEFSSNTGWLVEGLIKNYYEYELGLVEWEEVGVEAVDDYTVKYTLEYSAPYFYTFGAYNILMPINKEFLESKGDGCKLGAPDKTACSFGAVDPTSILYNGGYLLESLDAKSQVVMVANPEYWDAEHVYIQNVKLIYSDGSDVYAQITGFENGTYVSASLSPMWADFEDYKEKYADNYYVTLPNAVNFYIQFNYNRTNYGHTTKTTDAERENTKEAMLNLNFRNALRCAFDRVSYQAVSAPEDVAKDMMRNITSCPMLVTTSDGTEFVDLVEKYYAEITGTEVDLSDGQDPFYNPDKAMEYINAAKADGVQFPITLDMPT